jgi:hypothetical protein
MVFSAVTINKYSQTRQGKYQVIIVGGYLPKTWFGLYVWVAELLDLPNGIRPDGALYMLMFQGKN